MGDLNSRTAAQEAKDIHEKERLRHAHMVAEQFRAERDEARAVVDRLRADLADAQRDARAAAVRIDAVFKLLAPLNDADRPGPLTISMIRAALSAGGGSTTDGMSQASELDWMLALAAQRREAMPVEHRLIKSLDKPDADKRDE